MVRLSGTAVPGEKSSSWVGEEIEDDFGGKLEEDDDDELEDDNKAASAEDPVFKTFSSGTDGFESPPSSFG